MSMKDIGCDVLVLMASLLAIGTCGEMCGASVPDHLAWQTSELRKQLRIMGCDDPMNNNCQMAVVGDQVVIDNVGDEYAAYYLATEPYKGGKVNKILRKVGEGLECGPMVCKLHYENDTLIVWQENTLHIPVAGEKLPMERRLERGKKWRR